MITRKERFFLIDRDWKTVQKCVGANNAFYGVCTFAQAGITNDMCDDEITLRAELYELKKYKKLDW